MKLVVEYEPQVFVFDIDDADYADFLETDESVYHFFDAFISDTSPEYSAKIVSLEGSSVG